MPWKVLVKINSSALAETTDKIIKTQKVLGEGAPFEYGFIDETIDRWYEGEVKRSRLLGAFSSLSILISSMGIFAMSIYYLQHKKKEIGIRKVNGATIPEITNLINRDFFSWITIAFLLAIPISWIIMDKWLQNFAYRINLSWWIFAVTIVIQLTIAFITICLQSQKAARENPINVLKSE